MNGMSNPTSASGMGGMPPMGGGLGAINNSFMKPQQQSSPIVSPAGSTPRNGSTPNLDNGKRDPFADLGMIFYLFYFVSPFVFVRKVIQFFSLYR